MISSIELRNLRRNLWNPSSSKLEEFRIPRSPLELIIGSHRARNRIFEYACRLKSRPKWRKVRVDLCVFDHPLSVRVFLKVSVVGCPNSSYCS